MLLREEACDTVLSGVWNLSKGGSGRNRFIGPGKGPVTPVQAGERSLGEGPGYRGIFLAPSLFTHKQAEQLSFPEVSLLVREISHDNKRRFLLSDSQATSL